MERHFGFILLLVFFCFGLDAQTTNTGLSAAKDFSGWQTYSNNKYGFQFQYPGTWSIYGKETNAIDRKGNTMSVIVVFHDTVSNSFFSLEYHLPPFGAELYKYSKAQYDSLQGTFSTGAKQIEIDGNKAIEGFANMSSDSKGNIVAPPLKVISIHFLDKHKTGEYELHFRTPLPGNEEIEQLMKVLSTIKIFS